MRKYSRFIYKYSFISKYISCNFYTHSIISNGELYTPSGAKM